MKFRHRVALGLTVVGLIACAAAAPAAQAFKWTASAAPASLTGTQATVHSFKFEAGKFTCNTAKFAATMTTISAEKVSFAPSYGECVLFGLTAKIETGGCEYVMRAIAMTAADEYSGGRKIECPAGHVMVITQTGSACVIKIPAQPERTPVAFKDETSTADVVAKFGVLSIEYTQSSACSGGAGTFTGGSYEGTSKISTPSGLKIQ